MTPSMVTETLMQFMGLQPNLFAANSRYLGLDTSTYTTADGGQRSRLCKAPLSAAA